MNIEEQKTGIDLRVNAQEVEAGARDSKELPVPALRQPGYRLGTLTGR